MLFPCNQFLNQEPSQPNNESVKKMSQSSLSMDGDASAIMMQMIDVNGKNADPVFQFLRYNSKLYREDKNHIGPIRWNFTKFLVDSEGGVFKYYSPQISPLDMAADIELLLSQDAPKTFSRAPTTNFQTATA